MVAVDSNHDTDPKQLLTYPGALAAASCLRDKQLPRI